MITKGEWSSDYGDYSIFCETGAEIARVVPGAHDDGSVISDREMEANLELLAAAPELLEALKILRAQIGDYRDGQGAAKFHACNIADTAISKAEGRPIHCPKCAAERGIAIPRHCPHAAKT
jgi:hypothetical protein